ncbi:MAG: Planctomycete cytochrome [Gemmataceae bacterium]|nr:Planctomycete cytochrome [Gemmataceae bacterium]
MMLPVRLSLALAALAALTHTGRAADDPKAVEFFETKIRPVLVEQCYKCHSDDAAKDKKLRGGLKLDSKANWQKGGDTGPAVVPGKPAEGTLIASLKYQGETQMPPKGKLPAAVVADFEKWVKDGAVDPRGDVAATKTTAIDIEKGRQFWSLQLPHRPKVPEVRDSKFEIRTEIDSFVHAKWDEKGLKPVHLADKRTLVRRAYFDLLGLPPTPDEVEAFVTDTSPDAYPKLIDQLLASPHYGERWARYWLDVARYAEDQAHTFAVKPKTNAYVYRDWVIRAFNADMPYDTFVRLQLAGDLLPEAGREPFTQLAGLGFLGLGAEYYKNTAREQAIAEELDDRVDVVSRAFLGLTVSCARCHDHKFDPIPTRDYYSLAGLFYGTNLTDAPLAKPDELKKYNDAQAKVKDQETAVNALLGQAGQDAAKSAVALTAKYLLAARKVRETKTAAAAVAKADGLDRYFLDRWVKFLDPGAAGKAPAMFKDWFALKPDAKPADVKAVAEAVQQKLAAVEIPETVGTTPKGKKPTGAKPADPLTKVMFLDPTAPLFVAPADVEKQFLTDADKPKLAEMRAELEKRKKESPPAPLQAPVLSGAGQGMKVYIRGNPAAKGEDAPKGFLQVLAKATPADPKPKDYTRLDLANAIATPDNPLTARVIVNRVWQAHFGRGLVNTPSNFGALGDRPSHPELLDYLAVEFVKRGWSIKWLHRQIMRSAAYQLASEPDAGNGKIDAANVYLWRSTRRRLDVEAWRDSLLAVSGNLDATMGGPTYDLKDAGAKRRTVYAKISRHELDGLLRLFDFPDANVTADKRSNTTVPQQQLFALNSEFMVTQAKAFAARVAKAGPTDEERVTAAYRLAFNRPPETREVSIALAFLKAPTKPADKLTRWEQYAQALLAANEFMYVD